MDTQLISLHVTIYGATWLYLSGLYYRCKTGLCMFYPIILCLRTIPDVQSDSVVWNEAELVPIVVGKYVTESLACDIGLVERKVCSGLLRLPFSVSRPKTCGLQSLCELSTLKWCCDTIYVGNWPYFVLNTSIWTQYCIWVSHIDPIIFSWNFSH